MATQNKVGHNRNVDWIDRGPRLRTVSTITGANYGSGVVTSKLIDSVLGAPVSLADTVLFFFKLPLAGGSTTCLRTNM